MLCSDEAQEDLLSLMAVLDHWVFHIHSPDYSLGDIVGWIQKRVGCKRIEVSPQYLLMTSAGPSALMLLRWHQITPFQGELSVHSRYIIVRNDYIFWTVSSSGHCVMTSSFMITFTKLESECVHCI